MALALVAIEPGHDGSSNLRPSALQQLTALLQQVAATTAAAVGRAQTPSLNTTCYIKSTRTVGSSGRGVHAAARALPALALRCPGRPCPARHPAPYNSGVVVVWLQYYCRTEIG